MLLVAVGLMAVAAGGSGTFASFTAETANNGNYFATGTLFLHATKSGGNACKSEVDSGNANVTSNGCDFLFHVSQLGTNQTTTVNLKLQNAGSVSASKLEFALGSACDDSTPPTITTLGGSLPSGPQTTITGLSALPQALVAGTQVRIKQGALSDIVTLAADASASATSIDVTGSSTTNSYTAGAVIQLVTSFGASNLCSNLQFYVQEMDANWSSNQKCVYPTGGSTNCLFGATYISTIGTSLNDLTGDLWSGGPNGATALAAGKTRYFQLAVKSPAGLGNAQQNAQAAFNITWHIEQ
jgi:predicted ribosomally synthesized peptide with SipW-like signal peptide